MQATEVKEIPVDSDVDGDLPASEQVVEGDIVETAGSHRLLVATPCYAGGLTSAFHMSVIAAMFANRNDPSIEIAWMTKSGESLITRARNDIVRDFLAGNYDSLLFIDSDIGFSYEHIQRLVRSPYDVVAQPYPLKKLNLQALVGTEVESLDQVMTQTLSLCANGIDASNQDEDGFAEALDTGTGFMLIRRRAMEEVVEANEHLTYTDESTGLATPGVFDTMHHEGRYLSEDFAFCRRWQALGGKVYVDLGASQMLSHHGMMAYGVL